MESWFTYALLSGLFAGLYSFFGKISAEKNHNSFLVTAYSMFSCSFIALIFFFIYSGDYSNFFLNSVLGAIMGLSYFVTLVMRIQSLSYMSSVVFFPVYKVLGAILTVIVGMFFFTDLLSINEIIGIGLGLFVPLLLIGKGESKKHDNLKKGLILLLFGIVFSIVAMSMGKIVVENNLNLYLYIVIGCFCGGVASLILYLGTQKKKKIKKEFSIHRIKRTGILNGLFLFFSIYFFALAMVGNLATVYTINSFSILLPIILSIFIYRDDITIRKTLAIILSIVSILFFKI